MKSSENLNELATALAKAQAAFPAVPKHGKSHTGKYATLDDTLEAIREPMANNGLSLVQFPTRSRDGVGLTTRLMHSSGQWLEETFVMPVPSGRMNEAQAFGAALTYARRYNIWAVLGIAGEDDTDANIGQGKAGQAQRKQPRQPAPEQLLDGTLPNMVTIPMLQDLHKLGNAVHGADWKAVVNNYHEVWETESTKEWTPEQYWTVYKTLEPTEES